MKDSNIQHSVVFSLPSMPQMLFRDNMLLLQKIKKRKSLIPFVFLDLRDARNAIPLLSYSNSFAGVKAHPLAHGYVADHPLCYEVLEYISANGYPLLVHSGWGELGSLRYIEGVARKFKKLKVIVAHMVLPDCLDVVRRNDNMWIDTSYASHVRRIEQAVKICGEDKIIFGSDYPFSDPRIEKMKIEYAKISDKAKEKIFYKNIKGLLKWQHWF
jgi:predicted TIM-barrel fold metal-dependent hydrolase